MPHRASLACAVALCLTALTACPVVAGAAPPPTYRPPVEAPVVDPFRPPATTYGPGNRGLEYGTAPGTEVRAAGDGEVVFAGPVAGSLHVTVRHPDGLRTTYSFLARIDVVVGQAVHQGDRVGVTVAHLHLGARVGDAYLDPASLFGAGPPTVRLVPFDDPPGAGPAGERGAISQLIGGIGGLLRGAAEGAVDPALAGTGATAAWLRDEGGQLLRTAEHYMLLASPGGAQLRLLTTGMEVWARASAVAHRPCTPAGTPPPPPPAGRRVAVLVGGLGSTSENAAIDDVGSDALGYRPADVVRFSYAGGRTPDPRDGLPGVPATTYTAPDTQVDLHASAARLADLVEQVAAAAPGAPIDLYAHSQGGLVTRLALAELERRHGAAWLQRLGLVATLASPHGGADLATAVYAVGTTQAGSQAFDGLAGALGLQLDDDAPSSIQLAETSDVVAELARTPMPAGVRAVSIAARGDLVVPVPRTAVAGVPQAVVPVSGVHAHDALPGSPEAARELALALAGLPPTCTTWRQAVADQLTGEAISWGEDSLGALAWIGAARLGPPLGG
jgi:hypothetical protein